jgi:DnaJ family protein A protein 5
LLCHTIAQESDGAEEEQQQQHYCIVCEKRFRSAGQLANHERSRAHREALAALMEVLQEEEAWLLVSTSHLIINSRRAAYLIVVTALFTSCS